MLARAFQAVGLVERVMSGSFAQTVLQATAGTGPHHQHQPSACSLGPAVLRASYATLAPSAASALSIHPSAATRLKELATEKAGVDVFLRIDVEGGGCSGFQYKFSLDDQLKPDDIVFEQDGGRVVCDNVSLEFLRGATLEYEDTLMRSAFTIASNPNAEASCGCGSSFAAKMK